MTLPVRHLSTHIYWLPKQGNAAGEYEDAFYAGRHASGDLTRTALAIADGATESLLSGKWAQVLVQAFVRHWDEPEHLGAWLADTLRAWSKEKRAYLEHREKTNPVQWYEEPGLEAGAFAALLGLVITGTMHPAGEGGVLTWNAAALGDCCLFQVRDGACICAFPMSASAEFSNRPYLLSSNPARNTAIAEHFVFASGEARRGDRLYLMTDALAAWFLRAAEKHAAPWDELDHLRGGRSSHKFAKWVQDRRAAHALRNDDVTLMVVDVLD